MNNKSFVQYLLIIIGIGCLVLVIMQGKSSDIKEDAKYFTVVEKPVVTLQDAGNYGIAKLVKLDTPNFGQKNGQVLMLDESLITKCRDIKAENPNIFENYLDKGGVIVYLNDAGTENIDDLFYLTVNEVADSNLVKKTDDKLAVATIYYNMDGRRRVYRVMMNSYDEFNVDILLDNLNHVLSAVNDKNIVINSPKGCDEPNYIHLLDGYDYKIYDKPKGSVFARYDFYVVFNSFKEESSCMASAKVLAESGQNLNSVAVSGLKEYKNTQPKSLNIKITCDKLDAYSFSSCPGEIIQPKLGDKVYTLTTHPFTGGNSDYKDFTEKRNYKGLELSTNRFYNGDERGVAWTVINERDRANDALLFSPYVFYDVERAWSDFAINYGLDFDLKNATKNDSNIKFERRFKVAFRKIRSRVNLKR